MIDPRSRAWGAAAERAVRAAYEKLGYFSIPVYAIQDGGAPMLTGAGGKYVSPDLLLARRGTSRFKEVKYKDHCVQFGKTGYWRHGVDLPNWHHYRKVEEVTGIPGDIAILQYRPGPEADPYPCLLEQSFEHLAHTIDFDPRSQPHAPRGMAYWNVDEMDVVCLLDFDFTDVPRLTKVIHTWERKARDGRAPAADLTQQQRSLFSPRKKAEVAE
jgi:hypothetical protein